MLRLGSLLLTSCHRQVFPRIHMIRYGCCNLIYHNICHFSSSLGPQAIPFQSLYSAAPKFDFAHAEESADRRRLRRSIDSYKLHSLLMRPVEKSENFEKLWQKVLSSTFTQSLNRKFMISAGHPDIQLVNKYLFARLSSGLKFDPQSILNDIKAAGLEPDKVRRALPPLISAFQRTYGAIIHQSCLSGDMIEIRYVPPRDVAFITTLYFVIVLTWNRYAKRV